MFAKDFDPAGNEPSPPRRRPVTQMGKRVSRVHHQTRTTGGIVRLEAGVRELLFKPIGRELAGAHACTMASGARVRHLPRVKSGNSIGRPFFATD